MLTPFDDYPVHQTPLPLAHVGDGHPDHYDRFWFNGYNEDLFFAVALGLYPNRGIIDTTAPDCIHIQQVMRARWGDRTGLGVLEQLAIGPHAPSGFTGLFDGARTPAKP